MDDTQYPRGRPGSSSLGLFRPLAVTAFSGWSLKSASGILGPCSAWKSRAWVLVQRLVSPAGNLRADRHAGD